MTRRRRAPRWSPSSQTLPAHDLLFVRRDVSHPKVIDAWMRALDDGAHDEPGRARRRRDGRLHGDRHRRAVAGRATSASCACWWRPAWRGRGLGRLLIQECFALALELGLEKLVVQMTVDQRAAIAVFEELGFRAEAVLRRHVEDRDGKLHDLVLLSHDVDAVQCPDAGLRRVRRARRLKPAAVFPIVFRLRRHTPW